MIKKGKKSKRVLASCRNLGYGENNYVSIFSFLQRIDFRLSDRTIRRIIKENDLNTYEYPGVKGTFIKPIELIEWAEK